MTLNKRPYKGTRDFFPKDKRQLDFLFNKMKETALSFGYEPYDGPILEEVDLYRAKSGEELINAQIYSFIDRGGREVAIRPEMTPTVARMVAQVHRETIRPIRWFTIVNLMRYERPQRGRLREHWQFNCDIFGPAEVLGEMEILQIIISLLNNFGADQSHFEILINDRRIVDFVFKKFMKLDDTTASKLYKILDRFKKEDKEIIEKLIQELSLGDQGKIFWDYVGLKSFGDLVSFLKGKECEDLIYTLNTFVNQMEDIGLLPYLKYDPTIVRGLDYYTGMVFEVFDKHPENRRALCGGGVFADLLKIFDEESLPGVGFGLGDVTLADFLISHKLMPSFELPENDLLLTFQDEKAKNIAFNLASKLRKKGLKVLTNLESIKVKKVFPLAEKKGCNFVALFGEEEINKECVQIKNLKTKEQHEIKIQNIDEIYSLIKGL
jgi:histidyl-tRNA synthetase